MKTTILLILHTLSLPTSHEALLRASVFIVNTLCTNRLLPCPSVPVLFNDPHIFGYLRNTWSLRSLAKCLTDELDIPISFKHVQRITKDLGVRCKRPKLELLHGEDYEEGKERVENYKQIASALKKRES